MLSNLDQHSYVLTGE